MHIQVQTDNIYIRIKIFENPGATKWFNFYQQVLQSQKDFYKTIPTYKWYHPRLRVPEHDNMQWDIIKTALAELANMGLAFPHPVPEIFDYDQNLLNLLHRFFTYNEKWYYDKATTANPFDPSFQLPKSYRYDDWSFLLGKINEAVHTLEQCCRVPNRKLLAEYPIETISVHQQYHSTWLSFSPEEQQENYIPIDYSMGPAVTLNQSIRGKCLLQTFLDDDDPHALDCTGRLGSYGGFDIDVTRNREKIYQSPEFLAWLAHHKVTDLPLEFQIGYVVDTNLSDLSLFCPGKTTTLDFLSE